MSLTSILKNVVRTGWDVFGRHTIVGVDVTLWQVVLTAAVVVGALHYARRSDRIVRRREVTTTEYVGADTGSEDRLGRVLSWGPLEGVFDEADDETIERYELNQRLYYWGAGAAIVVLFVSGYALLVPGSVGEAPLMSWLYWHVLSSVVLTVLVAIHMVVAPTRGDLWAMVPTRDDVRIAVRSFKQGAGRVEEYPRFGKYSPIQQTLHWLAATAVLALIATGVFLLRSVPMPWWDATRHPFGLSEATKGLTYTVHGVVAGLLLGVLLLHVYFGARRWEISRSIFTGTISREAYEKYYEPVRWTPEEIAVEEDEPDGEPTVESESVDDPTGADGGESS